MKADKNLKSIRPTRAFLGLIACLMLVSLIFPLIEQHYLHQLEISYFYFGLVFLAGLALFDIGLSWISLPDIGLKRIHETNISLNVTQTVTLILTNQSTKKWTIEVVDILPEICHQLTPLTSFDLAAQSEQKLSYQFNAVKRGAYQIPASLLRCLSRFGFWQVCWQRNQLTELNVFPNFSAIADLAGLNGSLNLTQAGLKVFNKRGSGMDFNQLRDYREGDSIRQIDWAATSRFNKPISREYQEEKNQNITVLLDCGKRMKVQDDELSYFDHALNALILLSYTVLKSGDQLSFMSFGEQTRWLGKVKGGKNVGQVLNHFFDLYPDAGASDYLATAQTLMKNQHKRSLTLLVTCLRDEDFADLLEACKLLQQKHLVAVVSITEPVYENMRQAEVVSFEQALAYSSASLLEHKIKKRLALLQHQGVICFQVKTHELTAKVINTYLSVKKSGLL
ncbi:DUF58 domain-containing protein [Catenovulum sp. 2E275]|uniref:DUF58 domain-containing protein n=1 Tax=Catenovulum sp. 2E275 TaxID=2980497 RepID=UPI0021D031B6|nr:DUF58 domain-containing protein [Catenovulum sp. 2E275]MCU4675275.1 DUF58 domain-containing protein [Catenovulum sp. 2E275]